MNFLSSTHRSELIQRLQSKDFDLVIIGGGITGAGIALDAASRGLTVALIEKEDFAAGTSSKSTKLIHGGLRYLKQLEVGLVREVGRERATVHRLAPHLVTAEKMLLPLIKGGTFGAWSTSIGLWVYDLVAGVSGDDKRKMLNKDRTLTKEPLLDEEILLGSGYYAEYRTDDARLTIENIKTAYQYGALSINYVKAEYLEYDNNGMVTGVACSDQATGNAFTIRSKFVINATGPWVDTIREGDKSKTNKRLFLSKGVHIVVPHELLPLKQSIYFDVPDGRMIFAIPRHRVTYIGTTDTPYEGDINDIPINKEDVDYLLEAVNNMFPTTNLQIEDIESSWAGLRPLIFEEGKSASEMSRKDEIFESPSGLLSIAGGKLTGYRKMSERIVNIIARKMESEYSKQLKANHTQQIPLTGGPFASAMEVNTYKQKIALQLKETGLIPYYADYLIANYGKQTDILLEKMQAFTEEAEIALVRAEIWYSVHQELSLSTLDFLNRRTGRLYFNMPSVPKIKDVVLTDFSNYLGWTDSKQAEEALKIQKAIERITIFPELIAV